MLIIRHWRYEDGTRENSVGNLWKHEPPPRGWYCWVYNAGSTDFIEWMAKMCPTADCTHRFNSGDPMTTVYIKDDKEATAFALKWM